MNPTLQGSTFDQWVDQYLRRQRSLGRAYVHEEHVIGALRRFSGRTAVPTSIKRSSRRGARHKVISLQTRGAIASVSCATFASIVSAPSPLASSQTLTAFHIAVRMHRRSSLGRPRSPGCWPWPIVWRRLQIRRFGRP